MDTLRPISHWTISFLLLSILPDLIIEARFISRNPEAIKLHLAQTLSFQRGYHQATVQEAHRVEIKKDQMTSQPLKVNLPDVSDILYSGDHVAMKPVDPADLRYSSNYAPGISIDQSTCDPSA
jgi:hypothetical protein